MVELLPSSTLFPYTTLFRSYIGLDNYADVLGSGWGALAFFGGVLLIMGAHWLWTDAFRRHGGATYLRVAGAAVLLASGVFIALRSEEHTSELQSRENLVCRL